MVVKGGKGGFGFEEFGIWKKGFVAVSREREREREREGSILWSSNTYEENNIRNVWDELMDAKVMTLDGCEIYCI